MLILPIVNKNRVLNVEIKLRNAQKIKRGVSFENAGQSEIIVNREKFSDSSFSESKAENAPTDFIRSRSILYPRNFLVTTKEENDSPYYDVYQVAQPPKRVNDCLDKLYGKAITDMQMEIPGVPRRGRYISFEKLGLSEHLSDEKIAKLQRIVKEERNLELWPKRFEEEGLADLGDTIDFINNFECTVLSDTVIPESSLQDTLKALEVLNSRDYRNLRRYYDMAKSNTNVYAKISYISQIIYDRPLVLKNAPSNKAKQLIKKKEEYEYQNVA